MKPDGLDLDIVPDIPVSKHVRSLQKFHLGVTFIPRKIQTFTESSNEQLVQEGLDQFSHWEMHIVSAPLISDRK